MLIITVASIFGSFKIEANEKQLQLERAARIVASAFASGNANDRIFEGNKNYKIQTLKEITHPDSPIVLTVEHSISEEKVKPYEIKGFEALEHWIKTVRNPDEHDFKYNIRVRTLGSCNNNCCEFPFTYGILHNTLYLKKVCFVEINSKPFLKGIHLYNGD